MAEWGRKEYAKAWPSRRPVWTMAAVFATMLVFAGLLTVQYERSWTAAQGLYWKDYLKSGTRAQVSARSSNRYTLLEGMMAKGRDGKEQGLFLKDDQVETVTGPDGQQGWRLTEAGTRLGIARLQWVTATFNDRSLHRLLSSVVYADLEGWGFYRVPVYTALAFFVLSLFLSVPKDRKRRMIWKHGRRLRGPELVTTSEFNAKLGKSNLLTTTLPNGVSFINEETGWWDKTFHKDLSRWARVPRDREAMHFLIVGDSGTGKSAAIRQMLDRPELEKCLERLDKGDTLVVWRLDRLGRSIRDLLQIVDRLEKSGVNFISLKERFDTSTAAGRLVFHFFAALTQFEKELIRERTMAGLSSARARGRMGGRKRLLTAQQAKVVKTMWDSHEHTRHEIAANFSVSVATIDRLLRASRSVVTSGGGK